MIAKQNGAEHMNKQLDDLLDSLALLFLRAKAWPVALTEEQERDCQYIVDEVKEHR